MDEKINATVEKIKLLAKQNSEFAKEMQNLFGTKEPSSDLPILTSVSNNVSAIRSALEIRATESLKYSFVRESRLRDQLIIDNLRMENAALNLQEKESDRFYIFCVNAFYQLENIINYYYYVSYPNIDGLLDEIESATEHEEEKFRFKRKKGELIEKTVADISIYYKINAMCNTLFPDNISLKLTLNNLRKVRNEGEHRCQVIQEKRDENDKLYQFLQNATFNSVRAALIKVVNTIEYALTTPVKEIVVEGVVKTMLPSMCYVSYGNKNEQVAGKLFNKLRNAKEGTPLKVTLYANKIKDINL